MTAIIVRASIITFDNLYSFRIWEIEARTFFFFHPPSDGFAEANLQSQSHSDSFHSVNRNPILLLYL